MTFNPLDILSPLAPETGRPLGAKAIVSGLPQGVGIFTADLRLCEWSQEFATLLQLQAEDLQAGIGCADLFRLAIRRGAFSPDDSESFCQYPVNQAMRGQFGHCDLLRADNHTLNIHSIPMVGGGFALICTDITERRANARNGQLSLKMFLHAPDGILFTDHDHHIIEANPASAQLTGYEPAELVGRTVFGLIDPASPEMLANMREHLAEHGRWDGEIELLDKSGDKIPVSAKATCVEDQQAGQPVNYIWLLADISERQWAEAQMRHITRHDTLTGLPNRAALAACLAELLPKAQERGQPMALLLLDLDRFKMVNDTLGHQVGDQMLCEIATRISRLLRETDYVARIGGDEFVIILPDITLPADAAAVANKIIAALAASIRVEHHELHTSPSIGISIFPGDGVAGDTLLMHADAAMYHAKASGRNTFQFFTAEMNRLTNERLEIERKLRHAIMRNELTLYYQPQFTADAGQPTGVEALLRWPHPVDGQIPPDRFIPVAEETGLIIEIGEWVLVTACHQMKRWLNAGLAPLRMAVNVSARQLRQRHFCEMVAGVLADSGLPPELLEIEITESSIMENPQETIGVLTRLCSMGVTLAIDDFGTGYSSLAYLKLFPLDHLKIDRSFVADIEHDLNDRAIAFGTIALAHSLNLKVIAEGVETEEQHKLLRANGCDEIQGYFLSRPLNSAAAFAFLHARCPAP
ncbi:MAG: EAL domain-containing protein [Azonexus sp.]|nr:EAL domain-containing protein [Azonexus sp.]